MYILRTSGNETNPTLPGGVTGEFITLGRPFWWKWDTASGRCEFGVFICEGGRFGIDALTRLEYSGVEIAESGNWKLHRGLLTKQITPKVVTAVDAGTDTLTSVAHGYAANDPVRLRSTTSMPGGIQALDKLFVINPTADTFQLSETSGGAVIDITSAGSGTLRVWKADAGYDDPEQGLPTYLPDVTETFSGIAYVEGKFPVGAAGITASTEPDWTKFKMIGRGERLMEYDSAGAELGIVDLDALNLANPAIQLGHAAMFRNKLPASRIDYPSLADLKAAANASVWHRTTVNGFPTYTGLEGEYFSDTTFTNRVHYRLDSTIDFNWTAEPATYVPTTNYSVRWTGKLLPRYTETYTFKVTADDTAVLKINGATIVTVASAGTQTGTVALTKDTPVSIIVEMTAATAPNLITVKWSSPSQIEEVIPTYRLYPDDSQAARYGARLVSVEEISSGSYWEMIMERVPGWDWANINGKVTFLSPERSTIFTFTYDGLEKDKETTFLSKSFSKKRRLRRDRPNFKLYALRNMKFTGYPTTYVEGKRDSLRELQGGKPDNKAPTGLGVMSQSLAERIAELDMKLRSDAGFTFSLKSDQPSGKVKKAMITKVFYYDVKDHYVAESFCLVTSVIRSPKENTFTLLPIELPLYADEAV